MTLQRSLMFLAVAGTVVAGAIWLRSSRAVPGQGDTPAAAQRAEYVGAATCRQCHVAEYSAWETSHHAKAMQEAAPGTVVADFGNTRFPYGPVTSTFLKRDQTFVARTDAPDGQIRDYDIKYTFGVDPLQQYLIELPGGRLQALSVAWDSRPQREGGQRWFHLYPGHGVDHADELHWTGRQQNWNFMCADCHSTNLRKGYDAANDRFQTTWSEINVACEACHGPGSQHVAAPRAAGLPARLSERRGVTWAIDPVTLVPRRSAPRTTNAEINVCAQCHSRREQIAEGYTGGAALEDYYSPSLITPGLFYADGQQRDEVYTHASFLQSRMAHAGVTCADCHEPHSQRLRAEGNALCGTCHTPTKYDAASHHFHAPNTAGAACVSCHMPETTYMQIDARRDHSIRVPRPDRSVSTGAPNACTQCHRNRTPAWAATEIRRRIGRPPGGFQTFAEAFHASETGERAAADSLRQLAEDRSQPAIVRASAIARLAGIPGRVALDTATRHLGDADPAIRRAALSVFEGLPPQSRVDPVAPLLRDGVRAVRVQAAWVLAPAATTLAGTAHEQPFFRAAEEFIAARRLAADRPEDRTTLGTFFAHLGRRTDAAAEYRAAIRLAPRYTPAYVNLSDQQREDGAEPEAERTLRQGLTASPADAALHHALGLSLARSGRQREAIEELKRAAELATDARYTYTYAVALHSSGNAPEALAVLERALPNAPRDRDLLFALATFHRDAGRRARALEYAEQLQRHHPDDSEAAALVGSLRQ